MLIEPRIWTYWLFPYDFIIESLRGVLLCFLSRLILLSCLRDGLMEKFIQTSPNHKVMIKGERGEILDSIIFILEISNKDTNNGKKMRNFYLLKLFS